MLDPLVRLGETAAAFFPEEPFSEAFFLAGLLPRREAPALAAAPPLALPPPPDDDDDSDSCCLLLAFSLLHHALPASLSTSSMSTTGSENSATSPHSRSVSGTMENTLASGGT